VRARALTDAAYERVRTDGAPAVSLRAVCREVGVTPAAAYHHFPDREALLRAVAGRALGDLATAARHALAAVPAGDHRRRLTAISRAYVTWALDEPHLFRLALGPQRGYPGQPVDPEPLAMLSAELDGLVADGSLTPARRRAAEIPVWAATHGTAALLADGPLQPPGGRAGALHAADRVVETVLRGLRD
jgi:AcrR family transcriptional regulator